MKKVSILFITIFVFPAICFSGERYISIGDASFYLGQPAKDVFSYYNKSNKYRIQIDRNTINEAI